MTVFVPSVTTEARMDLPWTAEDIALYSLYHKGVRTDATRAVNAKYARLRRRGILVPTRKVNSVWRHGTCYAYKRKGCRCQECTDAATLYEKGRRYRASLKKS